MRFGQNGDENTLHCNENGTQLVIKNSSERKEINRHIPNPLSLYCIFRLSVECLHGTMYANVFLFLAYM